jgi:hypothetical protein
MNDNQAPESRRQIRFNNQSGKNHTIRAVQAKTRVSRGAAQQSTVARRTAPVSASRVRSGGDTGRSSDKQRESEAMPGRPDRAASRRRLPPQERRRAAVTSKTLTRIEPAYNSTSGEPDRLRRYGYGA